MEVSVGQRPTDERSRGGAGCPSERAMQIGHFKTGNDVVPLPVISGESAESEPAPTAVEQVAVTSSDNSLPFTGFLAIPLLAIGVGMVLLGGAIAFKTRRHPAAH